MIRYSDFNLKREKFNFPSCYFILFNSKQWNFKILLKLYFFILITFLLRLFLNLIFAIIEKRIEKNTLSSIVFITFYFLTVGEQLNKLRTNMFNNVKIILCFIFYFEIPHFLLLIEKNFSEIDSIVYCPIYLEQKNKDLRY